MNIENKKQFATILLAVGIGLVAAFLTSQYVQTSVSEQTNRLAQEYEKKNSGLIRQVEGLKQELGKVNQAQMELAKRAMTKEKEGPASASPATAFSVKTPKGKRALTILIDSLSAVGGLVTPGDHVDVLAHLKMPEEAPVGIKPRGKNKDDEGKKLTSILFQDVEVLAVGTNYQPGAASAAGYQAQQNTRSLNVTLALNPEEVGLLTFAQANGRLQLSLRPPAEKGKQVLEVASWKALADFVYDQQGTRLMVPAGEAAIDTVEGDAIGEVRPFIQIFKSGREATY